MGANFKGMLNRREKVDLAERKVIFPPKRGIKV
jgi:hypothetical protein